MGALLRKAALGLVGVVATYAMKKMLQSVQKQAEAMQADAQKRQEAARSPGDTQGMKQLKQDPVTGVYYAED
jgi:type II secretory pathway pseudopilin PulG